MARTLYAVSLLSFSLMAAEPVNQDADLTLDLLEFLAEFGEHADAVPVDDDELDEAQEAGDEKAEPQAATAADVSKRGEHK